MRKFLVTWTFIRHIHRQHEYKLLTKIIEANDEHHADFKMISDPDVRALYSKSFKKSLKSIYELPISTEMEKEPQLKPRHPHREPGMVKKYELLEASIKAGAISLIDACFILDLYQIPDKPDMKKIMEAMQNKSS